MTSLFTGGGAELPGESIIRLKVAARGQPRPPNGLAASRGPALSSRPARKRWSPARDAGDNTGAPATDQRGFARLFDGDGDGVTTIDIGAVESGFIVNSFLDSVDVNPNDGISADNDGLSSLRAAINEANSRPGRDTIILPSGTFLLGRVAVLAKEDKSGRLYNPPSSTGAVQSAK